jgi:hypothetical protein
MRFGWDRRRSRPVFRLRCPGAGDRKFAGPTSTSPGSRPSSCSRRRESPTERSTSTSSRTPRSTPYSRPATRSRSSYRRGPSSAPRFRPACTRWRRQLPDRLPGHPLGVGDDLEPSRERRWDLRTKSAATFTSGPRRAWRSSADRQPGLRRLRLGATPECSQ